MPIAAPVADVPQSFVQSWESVRHLLRAFCRRLSGGLDIDDEIFQRTAIRAWRGFNTYRRESSFLTWTYRIAKNEADRLFARGASEAWRRADIAVEDLPFVVPAVSSVVRSVDLEMAFVTAIPRAAAARWLSAIESAVLLSRLASDDRSWAEVGAPLGLTANTCAQTHCRAIPKLRVYVFMDNPALLGGSATIKAAYGDALASSRDVMTEFERDAFMHVILTRDGYRRRGWRGALRSACLKVSRKLRSSSP